MANEADCEIYYEDSVYTTETRPSTQTTMHAVQLSTTTKIVDAFLVKHLTGKIDRIELKEISHRIGQYLRHVAENFNYDQTEEIINCIVENFNTFIPKENFKYIPPKEIAQLFESILKTCHTIIEQQQDTDPAELVASIVDNVRESMDTLKVRNFTQHFLCEILKGLVVTMNIADIFVDERVEQLITILSKISGIIPKCINIGDLITSVMEYAANNFIDDLMVDSLRNFIENIITGLFSIN